MVKRMLQKQVYMVFILSCILSFFCVTTGMTTYAADINDVVGGGSGTSQSSKVNGSDTDTKSAGEGLANAWNQAAVDNNDLAEAGKFTAPFVKGFRFVLACVLAIFSICLAAITVLDLLYLAVPPVRKFLCAEQPNQSAGGMGGMGMGGMGMGMGRMGMGMGGGMGAAQPAQSGIGRFVSDEAVSALSESVAMAQPQGGMGMGMMGGMGGMGQAQAQPKAKSVILTYLKKRAFALVLFAVSVILLTSTLFTDLGLYIGQWIIDAVGGLF